MRKRLHPNKFRALSQEYAQLDEVVKVCDGYRRAQDDLDDARLMLTDSDPDLREMAEEEVTAASRLWQPLRLIFRS